MIFAISEGPRHYLSHFVTNIYKTYFSKQYLVVTFPDIGIALDDVHIPTLVRQLSSLPFPQTFLGCISHQFSHKIYTFHHPTIFLSLK